MPHPYTTTTTHPFLGPSFRRDKARAQACPPQQTACFHVPRVAALSASHRVASHRAASPRFFASHCVAHPPPRRRSSPQAVERGHNVSLFEGHAPWHRGVILDQIAIGTPRAMDAYAGLAAALPGRFAEQRKEGKKTVPQRGFVTEELMGTNVAADKAIVVRPVTWLQWGTKRDELGEQEWRRGGDAHLGGRVRWRARPPPQ